MVPIEDFLDNSIFFIEDGDGTHCSSFIDKEDMECRHLEGR